VVVSVLIVGGCGRRDEREATGRGTASEELALTATAPGAAAEDDGQWTMAAKDHAGTRFTGLAQIDTANVADLEVAWTFATGVLRGHEGAPLVIGDTLYVVTPFPNRLHALDAVTGALRWTYDPLADPSAQGVACCDVINRGAAYGDGMIVYATLDNQVVAVDAASGREAWKTRLGNINLGESMTMAPLIVDGKVLVGNSGGEFGVRGWITALDLGSGDIAWRAYSTGPDEDVLIGPDFRPFYEQDRGEDLGVHTWPPEKWRTGGGTVWGWLTYDPALDLIFHGTANPGPWNHEMRPGDNKWTAGIFARRPRDGAAIWFYQWSPHDLFDYDGVNESIVLDLAGEAGPRQVLVHPERNGYVYVLDRATGEVLSADPFVHVTTSKGVDLDTGRLIANPEKTPRLGKVVRDLCPFAPGAKDWQPSAWSPRTGLLYIPHNNMCMDWESVETGYIAGTPYVGAEVRMYPGPGGHRGVFTAWDPVARRAAWSIPEEFPVWSGALATGGDLVFYGTMDGHLKALDARSGELLWSFKTPSGIVGQPISYRGPDGAQYVAVLSGVGGWAGAVVSGELDPRDQTAGKGFAAAMADLPAKTARGGTLVVFKLPE
jgi:PQQ-dependent dehydrogenase (methanol/ethanol family)